MMNKAGTILYKCRLCGSFYEDAHAPDGHAYLIAAMFDFPLHSGFTVDRKNQFSFHVCADGRMGVSDLVGFRPDGE